MESEAQFLCQVCHQPIQSQWYFCPNCGAKLNVAPLSTSTQSQAWLYLFSIILPFICYIFIGKWQGINYLKSKDPKTKQVGAIACTLILLSTIFTIYFAYVVTLNYVQSQVASLNTAGLGNF
jgi:hypothetical protein